MKNERAHIDESVVAAATKARAKRNARIGKVVLFIVLSLGCISFMMPLVWMISTSLKAKGAIFAYPPQWIPQKQLTAWAPEVEEVDGEWVEQRQAGRLTHEGGDKKLFTATTEGVAELKVVECRNIEDAKVVMILEPASREGEIVALPLYRDTGKKVLQPTFEPIRELHVQWNNYPDAWNALTLRRPWLGFSIPYALRFDLFGKTFQIGPVSFEGFHIKSAFAVFYLNSVLVAICVTIGQVLTSSLAAYAFARLNFPGRDKLFLGYLGTLMVPYVVTMIPVFILLRMMHLIDTYAALILPAMFSAYGTFMLRQFFVTIPTELEDAARIDGCGKWRIYTNVILPLSKPALATLTTFVFLGNWNSFMWPLIVISSPEKKTLPIGLYAFMGQYNTEWTLLMAASMMVLLPVLIVFILGQRYFVKGIVLSGLKG